MTILEMLDRLEAEILSLRSGNRQESTTDDLALLPQPQSPAQTKTRSSRTKQKTKKAKKKKKSTSGSKGATKPAAVAEQMSLPVDNGAPGTENARILGKRQALGRSLSQLRRSSPHRLDGQTSP